MLQCLSHWTIELSYLSSLIFQIRYQMDSAELYGRILDGKNVVSSICGTSKEKTEEFWNTMYPNEPYELNLCGYLGTVSLNEVEASKSTSYDLVSAVKRQSPFYYQVKPKAPKVFTINKIKK